MTAAIQYILTAAQSLALRTTIKSLKCLLVYYSVKTSRHRQNGLSYVPKGILTSMLREARGDLKATVGNRVTTRLSLYPHNFLFFSVSFNQSLVFSSMLCSKAWHHILDFAGPSEAEV